MSKHSHLFSLNLIFFFSGFSSLIYQIVWQRLLTLYYGVGAVSIVLIVSVYMLGLGIGALWGGHLAEKVKAPVRLYFWIELILGLFGLGSLSFITFLGRSTAGSPYMVVFILEFLFLCVPTFFMGMTLPLLVKAFNRWTEDFFISVSSLYFINTLGAAVGALVASYVIISLFGLDVGIYTAAFLNFFLAGAIYELNGRLPKATLSDRSKEEGVILGPIVYFLVLITGFLAIGYEIIWYRVIGILIKDSPYAFSSILSVYLLGIALGSFGTKSTCIANPIIAGMSFFFFYSSLSD